MYHICEHPLISELLIQMRDRNTPNNIFRNNLEEITSLMGHEIFRHITLKENVIFVPVLRAGLGMLSPMLTLVPSANVGFVALERNHDTLIAAKSYVKIPAVENSFVVILDPMLATGGSLAQTVDEIKAHGYQNIIIVSLLAAPEGLAYLEKTHPDVNIYLAAKDEKLNDVGYIVPGLGDAGDRLYGVAEEN